MCMRFEYCMANYYPEGKQKYYVGNEVPLPYFLHMVEMNKIHSFLAVDNGILLYSQNYLNDNRNHSYK